MYVRGEGLATFIRYNIAESARRGLIDNWMSKI